MKRNDSFGIETRVGGLSLLQNIEKNLDSSLSLFSGYRGIITGVKRLERIADH